MLRIENTKLLAAACLSFFAAALYSDDANTPKIPALEKTVKIEKQYLNMPVKNGAEMKRINLLVDGKAVRYFDIELADSNNPDFWAFLDLGTYIGKDITIQMSPSKTAAPKTLDLFIQSDKIKGFETIYKEKYRPQFHFTSKIGWNNDTNGLVFYKGFYHLFYQHNPFGWKWGNMHWGHAISKDLIHWQELNDALVPDDLGTIFSGSAVIDWNNTTDFQTASEKPLVCIYTAAGSPFTQCIAYSIDFGRTFTKYQGNPVLKNIVTDNRDPKVIWHLPSRQWGMALFLSGDSYALFGSPNLKIWTKLSDIKLPGCGECPDFFELPLDGDKNNTRWIFWGANSSYLVGSFDGKTFTPQTEVQKLYPAGNAYAGQTFSDIPQSDGRRIHIAWLRGDMPNMPFNQQMTFPLEFALKTTPNGPRLFVWPVSEIESLYNKTQTWTDLTLTTGQNPFSEIKGQLFDIQADFTITQDSDFGFNIFGSSITYSAKTRTLSCLDNNLPLEPIDGKINLRILVDKASIELFANNGLACIPAHALLDYDKPLSIFTNQAALKINSLKIHQLNSIW